jgi:NAD(P)-dependent dehydrogenase (short-subunit alcohol dehydrogenase family)
MELRPLGVDVAIVEPGSVKTEIWRKGTESGREILSSMPLEARTLYGKRLEGLMESARKTAARGVEPIEVAEAIEHALTSRRPKTRYVVGADARAQLAIKALLPARVVDALTSRLSGT